MSISYGSHLIYGIVYDESDMEGLNLLVKDFGGPYFTEGKELLTFGLENPFYTKYPLLTSLNNQDQWSGELPEAHIIGIHSTMFDLLPNGDEFKAKAFPLRLSSLEVPSNEELASLNEFVAKYPTSKAPDWVVVTSIL